MNILIMKIFSILLIFLFFNTSFANNTGSETGLELPRFVSLKSNDSNIRVGPSKNYPIVIKYITTNFPLKVIDEYDDWRKILDFQNNTGWIHKSLIKGDRYGIIISTKINNAKLFNAVGGKNIGEISNGSIVNLSKCKPKWCLVIKNNYKGWVNKKYLWGVKKDEKFNIGFSIIFIDYYFKSINLIEKYFY